LLLSSQVYALALILKADSLLNTGRYHEASEMYEKALSLGDADKPAAGVLFNHSLALLHSGKKDESMLEMEVRTLERQIMTVQTLMQIFPRPASLVAALR
jgi:tetratricopeptide (TPR) repeat protein